MRSTVGRKIYLASDMHLGVPDTATSLAREKKLVRWLDYIKADASEIFLLGDLFDFWFEYKTVVPRGYIRILGKLAELRDAGIPITLFAGNHDLWLKDYFPSELGIPIAHGSVRRTFFDRNYFLAHGDGLGPGDHGYKLMKRAFQNGALQWLFHRLHPNLGIGLAHYFSRLSRRTRGLDDSVDYGEKEFLYLFVKDFLTTDSSVDFFVFGHRHITRRLAVAGLGSKTAEMFILGEWFSQYTYLEITEAGPELKSFNG